MKASWYHAALPHTTMGTGNWLLLQICCANISVRWGASNSVGWWSLTDHCRRNPFTACPPPPPANERVRLPGTRARPPQNNLLLVHWQMLLLVLVTSYPSYSPPYFPVNSRVSAKTGKAGQLSVSKISTGGSNQKTRVSLFEHRCTLRRIYQSFTGASWVYSEGKS